MTCRASCVVKVQHLEGRTRLIKLTLHAVLHLWLDFIIILLVIVIIIRIIVVIFFIGYTRE